MAAPRPRPYGQLGAEELAAQLEQNGHDERVLANLRAEVAYRIEKRAASGQRRNPAAIALLEQIDARIAAGPAPVQAQPVAPQPTTPRRTTTTMTPPRRPARPAANRQVELTFDQSNEAPDADDSDEATPSGWAVDRFLPPDTFCQVAPLGTQPRPEAYRPALENNVTLDVDDDDPPAKRYRVALGQLLVEMRRRRVGRQQFPLSDGIALPNIGGATGYLYQFDFAEEANLFEGAKVELVIDGDATIGDLAAILPGKILINLQHNFGDHIKDCILRIDNTAIIQALHDRIEKVENGEVPAFKSDAAAKILKNEGPEQPAPEDVPWPWEGSPTQSQRKFLRVALAHDVTWLWGPPGTGKTETLSALTCVLYGQGKRVLICSNTNQAVDQLLLKLCPKITQSALVEGRIVRLGRTGEELQTQFGEFVSPDEIVARKSETLIARKAEIETELELLGHAVAYAQEVLDRFVKLDGLRAEANNQHQQYLATEKAIGAAQAKLNDAVAKQAETNAELERFRGAGVFRRMVMRSEVAIMSELNVRRSSASSASFDVTTLQQRLAATKEERDRCLRRAAAHEQELRGENRDHHAKVMAEYEQRRKPLRDELSSIATQLDDIRASVLREARVVGATVTRTYLRPVDFEAFDAVILDEASMVLLPAVFLAVGLAKEKVVIAGDFQQLPPIIQTQEKAIHDVLAHDVFAEAGITLRAVLRRPPPRFVMLDEQFRMDPSICDLVSDLFYAGRLKTSPSRNPNPVEEPAPLTDRLTIIDTSRIWPFTTRNAFGSRLNLMHALAARNLLLHLKKAGRLVGSDTKGRVGVCTPYAAQAKLLKEILKSNGLEDSLIRASTVHSFQGDERHLMVIDLVDSVGEWNAGMFLQANQKEDNGAKLLNVALSRAKEGIVIIANLTFLDQKLPSDALLRGLLHDVQRKGKVVDVREILALYPIQQDLQRFGPQPALDTEAIRTGIFGNRDFSKIIKLDLQRAEKSIVVFSGFVTVEGARRMGEIFQERITRGVKVRCVTRPPKHNGSIPEEQGRSALNALESMGVAIDLRNNIHEKIVLIDGKVVWFGSLNPLSATEHTSEMMVRVESEGVAEYMTSVLSVRRSRPGQDAGTQAENPRCERCQDWSVLAKGQYGQFFACANGCGWRKSLDAMFRAN